MSQEIVDWLNQNLGEKGYTFITTPHERTEKLEFDFVPRTDEQFLEVINKAPWDILKGLGFRKWDTMNNIIGENLECERRDNERKAKGESSKVEIAIINPSDIPDDLPKADPNAKMEIVDNMLCVDISLEKGAPTQLLEEDEDILLIPGEWYNSIPEGFMVTGLWGESYPFQKGKSDDDIRFGCLPYGIRRKSQNK